MARTAQAATWGVGSPVLEANISKTSSNIPARTWIGASGFPVDERISHEVREKLANSADVAIDHLGQGNLGLNHSIRRGRAKFGPRFRALMGDPARTQCGSRDTGFEGMQNPFGAPRTAFSFGGTESSNPLCSSGESRANLTSSKQWIAIAFLEADRK